MMAGKARWIKLVLPPKVKAVVTNLTRVFFTTSYYRLLVFKYLVSLHNVSLK